MFIKKIIITLVTSLLLAVAIIGSVNAAPATSDPALSNITSFQTDANGNEFALGPDGSWTLKVRHPSPAGDAARFEWTYCYGNFAPYRLVNKVLEWGGQQTCDDPRTWPQGLTVRLESTCNGVLCIKFTPKGSVTGTSFGRVAVADTTRNCPSSNVRKYRMIVKAWANGGVQVGPFFDKETKLKCGG